MRAIKTATFLILLFVLAGTLACGGAPPQIVDYAPQRGAKDVSTAAPVLIAFDHDVDQASVASRLHLLPDTQGTIQWLSPRRLVFDHSTLATATTYQVILDAGYRDTSGNVYVLRHHWSFITEGPPAFAASNPAEGDNGVDPAEYLSVDFTRAMDTTSLKSAITFSPSVPFSVRLDPADGRRAIVAPNTLLEPNTAYRMLVTTTAQDADGNQLDRVRTISFTTGPVRPLHHWVAFATAGATGTSGGLWIVNESGFPRQLLDLASIQSYSWAPEGDRIVYQSMDGAWATFTPGNGSQPLDFTGAWAAALSSGLGYVYIDAAGNLRRELADGTGYVIANNISGASVSPDGERIAFAQVQADLTTKIWGYDVGLRSTYVLGSETAPVTSIAWSPAGNRIAYLLQNVSSIELRVRNLTASGTTTTVATGDIGRPIWLRDSDHLLFAAIVKGPTAPISKAFLVNAVAPPAALTAAIGLPSDPTVAVTDPVPSPDGHQIAFISADQVWLMNADGTRPTALTRFDPEGFPYSCLMPAWSLA